MPDEDEREITTTTPADIDAFRVETPEEDERLAASQREIDEAKAVAAELARETPDPLPGGDSAEGTPVGP